MNKGFSTWGLQTEHGYNDFSKTLHGFTGLCFIAYTLKKYKLRFTNTKYP